MLKRRMRAPVHFLVLALVLLALVLTTGLCVSALNPAPASPRVRLTLDASEAEQALLILHKEQAHQPVTDADWQKLFATVPYQWLKVREAGLHREFTDEDFKKFLQAPETEARTTEWTETLAGMERANMTGIGERILGWLPEGPRSTRGSFP